MVTIKSFQEREPYANSWLPTRTYSEIVSPSSFAVKAVKVSGVDINQITIFFPNPKNGMLGIGLELAAPEAIALAHAILGVAQGNVDEMTGNFQTE